jgi:hypothetical protein
MERLGKITFALCAPIILFGCILTPGKFVSTMTINADRSFAFTYKGEVIAIDPSSELSKGLKSSSDESADSDTAPLADSDETSKTKPKATAKAANDSKGDDDEVKRRALAEALSKEAGYRSVVYVGKGKYLIDYAISGRLDHSFVYPFNSDAEIIFPFLSVELRQGNIVRVRAPGFAKESGSRSTGGIGSGGASDPSKYLDGTFTLDTDAEIVSQNNEEGAKKVKGRSVIIWRATPLTKDAPNAALRLVN